MRLSIATVVTVAAMAVPAMTVLGAGGTPAQEVDGKALYETHCVKCHGVDGTPPAVLAAKFKEMKALSDPATVEGISEDSTVAIIDNGVGFMKPFKGKLDRDQELAIARYTRAMVKAGGEG